MLTKYQLYYGREQPPPQRIALRAGPLEMFFEQGDLRSIRLDGREIVRRIYVAVRDRSWGTIPARLSELSLKVDEDAFAISYHVQNQSGEIDFDWNGAVQGRPDGRITFGMDGTARSTFEKNRIGFCVLFPAGLAGQPAVIEHMDGTREETLFPIDICADQPVRPFENMKLISLPLGAAGAVEVRFEGDVFEMEDQRLWTDASYKVFCTPLALPYPVKVETGTRVTQRIELAPLLPQAARYEAKPLAGRTAPTGLLFVQPEETAWKPLPLLGLGMASHAQDLSAVEIDLLNALHPHHLRVDLPLSEPGYPGQLERAVRAAFRLGVGLEIALLISPARAEAELQQLRSSLEELRPPVSAWLVYASQEYFAGGPPVEPLVRAARQYLQNLYPEAPFSAGTNTDLVFLKRTPPPIPLMDRVCIALNPQVHAFDDLSLLETLEAQPMVVESARRLAGGLPVIVSPITLKPRFNPYASAPPPEAAPGTLPAQVDPRQCSLFGAGWTLGSLAGMVSSGALSATYYETTGWRGVMERAGGSPWPMAFPTLEGCVYPLYHVLADAGEMAGGLAARMPGREGQDGGQVSAVALRLGARLTVLMANHSIEPQRVRVGGMDGGCWVRILDETNAEFAMRSPGKFRQVRTRMNSSPDLILPPLGLVRLDYPDTLPYQEKMP